MIGFFEHQYLRFRKDHLRTLVAMARVDGFVHEDELDLLYKAGIKYKLKPRQIKAIIEEESDLKINVPDAKHIRMAQLYDMIEMMMADGVIEESEMEFCKNAFNIYGYNAKLIDGMLGYYNEGIDADRWRELIEDSDSFLISK